MCRVKNCGCDCNRCKYLDYDYDEYCKLCETECQFIEEEQGL